MIYEDHIYLQRLGGAAETAGGGRTDVEATSHRESNLKYRQELRLRDIRWC